MKNQENKPGKKPQSGFPENFEYPASDDIYNQNVEVNNDPDDLSRMKENEDPEQWNDKNEKDWKDDLSGEDLDIPGAELDDDIEEIGAEDEENNYYSLGGDNHDNLEENNGDKGL
jgi:hypothetical protein